MLSAADQKHNKMKSFAFNHFQKTRKAKTSEHRPYVINTYSFKRSENRRNRREGERQARANSKQKGGEDLGKRGEKGQ